LNDTQATEAAKTTLRTVDQLCKEIFGARFVASYAMGSLARGGFSPLVSDVDFGLIVTEPLQPSDAADIENVQQIAGKRGCYLADRLSIFWGSRQSLENDSSGGRFPPFDRLDLLDHATLISGTECRQGIPAPTREQLEVAGFEFALDYLATPQRIEEFKHPERIVSATPVYLSKTVLYPPRFLYTSDTNRVAGNDVAVEHYLKRHDGADAGLVSTVYEWRVGGDAPPETQLLEQLQIGLLPLYDQFLSHYAQRLKDGGRGDLASKADDWRHALGLE